MSDSLYREHILEHWREPHHFGELDNATHSASLSNPLCGDEIGMHLRVENSHITDIRFTGRGCAISIASTSLLTDFLLGKHWEEIHRLTDQDVISLLGVTPNPSRMKCAMLGLETVRRIL